MRYSRKQLESFQAVGQGRLSSLIPPRNYSDFTLKTSQLRVWLPEAANQGLKEVCAIHETSTTNYLTEYFVIYLFGHHELLRMRSNKIGLYEVFDKKYSDISLSLDFCLDDFVEDTPNLGKNIYPIKIWIPSKIKEGLELEAERSRLTLGELCRALICAHLFGRQYWGGTLKKSMLKGEPAAEEWENLS